jgi:putative endonuclease
MYYVYALYSREYDKIYIGSSSNVIARLDSHNDSRNKGWTAKYKPWRLIYSEEFAIKHLALVREKQLKSSQGRAYIRSLIEK